mgnify:CR=1 FL=1|jgi:hypothetical protein
MDYNWAEIFENKSDKELYNIYQGKSFLPRSVIPFAEDELKRRGFDFNNLELASETWRLSDIDEELEYLSLRNLEKPKVSFRQYLFIVLAVVLFTAIVFPKLHQPNILLISLLAGIGFLSLLILSINRDYNKRIRQISELIEKKNEILKGITDKEGSQKKQQILDELAIQNEERIEESKQINKNVLIVMITALIIILVIIFLKML